MISAGIDVVEAYDCWSQALETYEHNIGRHAENFDLTDVDAANERITSLAPDIIAGAPPCQGAERAVQTFLKKTEGVAMESTIARFRFQYRLTPHYNRCVTS